MQRTGSGGGQAKPAESEPKRPVPADITTAAQLAPAGSPDDSASGAGASAASAESQARSAGEPGPAEPAKAGEPAGDGDAMQVSVVPGITRYHRNECLLIRFLAPDDLEVMSRQAAADGGCVPCKACKPDQEAANLPVG